MLHDSFFEAAARRRTWAVSGIFKRQRNNRWGRDIAIILFFVILWITDSKIIVEL